MTSQNIYLERDIKTSNERFDLFLQSSKRRRQLNQTIWRSRCKRSPKWRKCTIVETKKIICWEATGEILSSKLSSKAEKQIELNRECSGPCRRKPWRNCKHNQGTNLWSVTMNSSWARDGLHDSHFIKKIMEGRVGMERTRLITGPPQCNNP